MSEAMRRRRIYEREPGDTVAFWGRCLESFDFFISVNRGLTDEEIVDELNRIDGVWEDYCLRYGLINGRYLFRKEAEAVWKRKKAGPMNV